MGVQVPPVRVAESSEEASPWQARCRELEDTPHLPLGSTFHRKTNLERDLPQQDMAFLNRSARLNDLEPAEILHRLGRPFDRRPDRLLHGCGRRPGKFDQLVDRIFHRSGSLWQHSLDLDGV
jgi:hypothetical protein